jgi:hypothetical protein
MRRQNVTIIPRQWNGGPEHKGMWNRFMKRFIFAVFALSVCIPVLAGQALAQQISNNVAVFAGLDKITARITSFEVRIDETVQFGALQVTPRVCYTRPPTEPPFTSAFVEVEEVLLNDELKRIFTGWMFASSPGLHAVEHPVFDVWLTNCKTVSGEADSTSE